MGFVIALVKEFSDTQYPSLHETLLNDLDDARGISLLKSRYRDALENLGIDDYKMLVDRKEGTLAVYLRNRADFDKFSFAVVPPEPVRQVFFDFDPDTDFRKVKRQRNNFQRIVAKTELVGRVHIEANREQRTLLVHARDQYSYAQFCELIDRKTEPTSMQPA